MTFVVTTPKVHILLIYDHRLHLGITNKLDSPLGLRDNSFYIILLRKGGEGNLIEP
jgi:hypothetical protein